MTALSPYRLTEAMTDPVRRLWIELRFAPAPLRFDRLVFTLQDLIGATALRLVNRRLAAWRRAGLVIRTTTSPEHWTMTDVARSLREPPPDEQRWADGCAGHMRASLWTAMRILRSFDLPELVIAAGAPTRSARMWVEELRRAGILSRAADGSEHWRLIHDLGPLHPRTSYAGGKLRVRDPNGRASTPSFFGQER